MNPLDLHCSWSLPQAGFSWAEGPWQSENSDEEIPALLVEVQEPGQARRIYAPLRDASALHRIFAETPPTREGVRQFANLYGSLGVGGYYSSDTASVEHQVWGIVGETLGRWSEEIAQMQEAVTLLDLVRAGDQAGLSGLLRWHHARVEDQIGYGPDSWVYHGRGQPVKLHGGTPSDILSPACTLVMTWVNDHLRGHTHLALATDKDTGKPTMHVEVTTLLACMWAQIAHAVLYPVEFRHCKTCQTWFAVPDDGRKAEALFCRDACKSRDYRERKAQALELARQGKTPKEIAEAVQTDITTVRKWIKKPRV